MVERKELTRQRIMTAAAKRFSHYGYAKATVAEIAADCRMSAGNLYRFFPGKLDIAEAIARKEETSRLAVLARIIATPASNARGRLAAFLSTELRSTYAKFEQEPHSLEIARIISDSRSAFVADRIAAERKMIEDILVAGTQSGEFDISDCAYMAEMIHSATLKFRVPQRWTHAGLETLERELEGVCKLIMDGLTPRASGVAA